MALFGSRPKENDDDFLGDEKIVKVRVNKNNPHNWLKDSATKTLPKDSEVVSYVAIKVWRNDKITYWTAWNAYGRVVSSHALNVNVVEIVDDEE